MDVYMPRRHLREKQPRGHLDPALPASTALRKTFLLFMAAGSGADSAALANTSYRPVSGGGGGAAA